MPGPRRRMRRRAVVGGAMIANHRADEQQAQSEQQPAYEQQPAEPVAEAETPPATPSMDQKVHEIEELARLRESGALTEEEFAQQKQQVLDS